MRTSNLQYLLCELNDENYTEPTFTVFNSHESAFKQAVERCTGVAYYYESDFELECKDNLNRISITFNKSPYGEDNNFYTTEIKEYDSAKGNYVLVWHHAYNGVGFDVELVGTYEECKQKMIDSVHKREIERDFIVKDGVATFPMKELPDWYGLTDIGFIWHGDWSDPEIEYKGKRINANIIEDSMWDRWIRDDDGKLIDGRENDVEGFEKFMLDNNDEVYELIELAMESEE